MNKGAIVFFTGLLLLFTFNTGTKQSSDNALAAEAETSYDRVPVSKNGVTFQIEELEKPENHLTLQSSNDVLEHLVKMTQEENSTLPSNIVAKGHLPENIVNFEYHSFFEGMYHAYLEHRPIVLSPDIIWLLISQGFSHHINANSEELRHHFVNFSDKKLLDVVSDKIRLDDPNSPWEEVFPEFVKKIAEYTGNDLINLLSADFTTTTPVEKIVSEITIMNTMKEYFKYRVTHISCGIPKITLPGTSDDWQKILDKTKQLSTYELEWWTNKLIPILQEFVNASQGKINNDFWKDMIHNRQVKTICGSETYIDGWILKFFPYFDGGDRFVSYSLNYRFKRSRSLPNEIVKVDFIHFDRENNIKTPMEFWAGFIGLEQNREDFALTPVIGWMIRKKDSAEN
ncbi:hypothetical protein FACS1894137_17650 [Spirochaetia bacterium]|nr:hypothetical protein FACS1894137_17650 [Spirochaetia bacterium]